MDQCKIGDESLRIEDRISQLPEALLLEILSLLSTENAIVTSVLSKRWRSLWKKVPNLKFIYYGKTDLETFSDNVCSCLLSHQAPILQSLHLNVSSDIVTGIDIGVLVGIAFGLHVRNLVLEVYFEEESFRFPRSLLNCETLESLKLSDSILVDVPSPVFLKSLRTLHLSYVEYKGDESVLNLLSGCSCLENLVVNRCGYDSVETFTISVPSLQKLTIIDQSYNSVYVINAPSLKYLKIEETNSVSSSLIENMLELVEANIDISSFESNLESFTSVKRLSLRMSPLEITFPTGSIFYQLVSLELCTYKADWWNLLTLMLGTSPNLQVLKLVGQWNKVTDRLPWGKWNQPKNVPECVLLCLETFVWTFYDGEIEDEKEVAKYILTNASGLKKAVFSQIRSNPGERVKMIEELESVVCLKSLKTLHLHDVEYQDAKSVRNLLSGCVNLENLVVDRNGHDCVKTFTIAEPSLKRLRILDDHYHSKYVINAPSLKYLKIEGASCFRSCMIENVSEVVEANIEISYAICENILESLTSIKRLSLSISPLEPCHKYIKLVPWRQWNQPKNVPECLLHHLETFIWKDYEWQRENEKEVAKYILRNASCLKKATFSKKGLNSKERVEMVEDLECVVKASNTCQLVFK